MLKLGKENQKGGRKVDKRGKPTTCLTLVPPPCGKNCPRRAWNCHAHGNCEAYARYVKQCEAERKARFEEGEVIREVKKAEERFKRRSKR